MFTFDYKCGECGYIGEEHVKHAADVVNCPRCAENDLEVAMKKMPSGFNIGSNSKNCNVSESEPCQDHAERKRIIESALPDVIEKSPMGKAIAVSPRTELPCGCIHRAYIAAPREGSPECN